MNSIARDLAIYLINLLNGMADERRLIVGIAGIPASGKSTLAQMIVDSCNLLLQPHDKDPENESESSETQTQTALAILVGLDGWHLTREQLDAFPDSKLAHDRRGAHWTFDGNAYVQFVQELRRPLSLDPGPIIAPSFDHSIKDPTPHAISVLPHHRIVVIEGLYTFLSIEPWNHAGEILDERWLIDVGEDEASRRLVKRHVLTGVARDLAEAKWRAEENDMPNGRFVINNLLTPTRIIQSVEDQELPQFPNA